MTKKQRMRKRTRSLLATILTIVLTVALSPLAPAAAQESLTLAPLSHDEQIIGYAYLDINGSYSSTLSIEATQRDESQADAIYIGPVYDAYDSAEELPWNKTQYSGSPYNISSVIIGEGVAPRSTAYWFDRQGNDYFDNFNIDMSAMDVSRWESARCMLYWSYAHRIVFPQGTADKLVDMSGMLRGTVGPLVDFDKFYAPNVENVGGLFESCFVEGPISVANLGANGTITSVEAEIITGVSYPMLDLCHFSEIDLTGFRTASSTDTTNLLRACHYMEKVTLDGALGCSNDTIILPSEAIDGAERKYSGENLTWMRLSDGETLPAGTAVPTGTAETYIRQLGEPDENSSQPTYTPEEEATDIHAVVNADGHMTIYNGTPASIPDGASVWYTKGGFHWQSNYARWLNSNGLSWIDYAANVTSASIDSAGIAPESTANWFNDCKNLTEIDFEHLDASGVRDMSRMFSGCSSLAELDLSGFAAPNIEYMHSALNGCTSLETLNLAGIGTTCSGTPFSESAYYGKCEKLHTVTVGADFKPDGWTLPDGVWQTQGGAIYRAENIPFGTAETYTRISHETGLFYALDSNGTLTIATAQADLPGSSSDFSLVTTSGYSSAEAVPWHSQRNAIKRVVFADTGTDELDCSYWFAGCKNLASVDLSGIGNLRDGLDMFRNCTALREVDLSNVDCSGKFQWLMKDGTVEYASTLSDPIGMYAANFARFTKDYSGMFDGCSSLESVTFPADEKTMKPTSLARMFRGCMALESVDLSHLDASTSVDFSEMFRECRALTALDLSSIDMRNARSMSRMLHGCRALRTITTGEDTTFFGATTTRMPGCEFPNGVWQGTKQASTDVVLSETAGGTPDSSGSAGNTAYASDSIPSFVADTYTRIDDPTGYTVVSLFGSGPDKYGIETAVNADGEMEVTYDLSSYERSEFTADAAVTASSLGAINKSTVGKVTIGVVKNTRTGQYITAITLGSKVAKVKAGAFANVPSVQRLDVKSAKLTTSKSVKDCLAGSNISNVHVYQVAKSDKFKKAKTVATAFAKHAGKSGLRPFVMM